MKEFYPLKGYENYYEISKEGVIRNKKTGNIATISYRKKNNCYMVTLFFSNKRKRIPYHKLLAYQFLPNPNNYSFISFKDGNRKNYNLSNLYWVNDPQECKTKYSRKPPVSTKDETWYKCVTTDKFYISDKGRVFSMLSGVILKQNSAPGSIKRYIGDKYYNLKSIAYATFFGEFDPEKYVVIGFSKKLYDIRKENLYLTRRCIYGESWVTKLLDSLSGKIAKHIEKGKDKPEKGNIIDEKHIIDLYNEQNKVSYFLKIPFDLTMEDSLRAPSLDRIDNNKTYEKGNVKLVTRFENLGRCASSFGGFKKLCEEIKNL